MTIAERYNAEALRLMPHMADSLVVNAKIDNSGLIDEIVFARSEYLGGMAAVLLAIVAQKKG